MDKGSDNSTGNKKDNAGIVQIIVAIITGVVAIVVALIGLAGILASLRPTPTPPISTAITMPTDTTAPTFTPQPVTQAITPFFSETSTPVSSLTETFTPIPVSSIGMHVSLVTNQTSGNRPLEVRFDARDSYFIAADGTRFDCGACDYFWQIRKEGVTIFGPRQENGLFLYMFRDRGTYYVSVYVCRSGSTTDCNGSGTSIIVN
ncbi:MAG: hypothetical protein IT315_12080 [Anaerolineales bacterium]|nr:hypothetical protein [Anaerolineales bacterium]